MQPRHGYFSIAVLNNMRALILILLSCCICFEFVNGANAPFAPTKGKFTFPTSSKSAQSDLFPPSKDSKSTMLDLKGAPSYDCFSIRPFIKSFATYPLRQKGATTDTTGGVPLFAVKIFLQLALTSVNMLSWAIPLRNKSLTENSKVLGLANSFAGGIFLMLAFGHMLPHSVGVLESIGKDRNIAFKFTLVGYLLVFFIEKIAFNSHALIHEAMDDKSGEHSGHSHHHDKINFPQAANEIALNAQSAVAHTTNYLATSSAVETLPSAFTVSSSSATIIEDGDNESRGALSPKSAIILLTAMSVHSLFETMALGLANDKTSAILMAASIGLHQPAESIALLVAFLKTSMPRSQIMKWLALFSAVGPLGVTTGVLISKIATPLMDGIIVAITAGTFLYVGATEVVGEEFDNVQGWEKWRKFGAFLGGMATILLVTSATDSWESSLEGGAGHGHGHGHILSPDL